MLVMIGPATHLEALSSSAGVAELEVNITSCFLSIFETLFIHSFIYHQLSDQNEIKQQNYVMNNYQ